MVNQDRVGEQSMLLETEQPLITAAKLSGNVGLVIDVLDDGVSGNEVDGEGRTALHRAVENGNNDVAMLLINSGQFDLNARDNKGHTALFLACKSRRTIVALHLVESGCDVSIADESGNTALHKAVLSCSEPTNVIVVSELCRAGSDVNCPNYLGSTPFYESLRVGNADVVKILLQNGAAILHTQHNQMIPILSTIFHYKIAPSNTFHGLNEILTLLILYGCQISNGHGQWSPLSACVNIENSYISAMLIFHGCRLDSAIPVGRNMIAEMFAKCESYVVKLFVMTGYHVTVEDIIQCARRVPSFSKSFLRLSFPGLRSCRHHEETLSWLKTRAKTPHSLAELSRISLRASLNMAANDTSIVARIGDLPLPATLKKFVALSDCVDALGILGLTRKTSDN